MPSVRVILLWLFVVFLVYAIFRSPNQAAEIVRSAVDGILALVEGVFRFFDALLRPS